jgi:hypothetical protein
VAGSARGVHRENHEKKTQKLYALITLWAVARLHKAKQLKQNARR